METEQRTFVLCDCGCDEHQMIIHKDDSDNYKEVIISMHLTTYRNIFKRIWVAIKYIFGYKSKYGHWDSLIITDRNYKPLKDAIDFIEQSK